MSETRSLADGDMSEAERAPDGTLQRPTEAELDLRFDRARGRLLGLARSLAGAADAEDVVHDAYLLARRRIGQLRDPAALDGWLNKIVVNRCYELRRRSTRLDRLLPRLHRTPQTSDMGLRELVERLPPRHRTVVVLHYGHGYSLTEIAELLDLSPVNARALISRARRRLFSAWQEADR